jgi:hypothetical protein
VTAVLVVGAGAVGARAAVQLAATPTIERVLVADADPRRAHEVAEETGRAEVVEWAPGEPFPIGTVAVACALPLAHDVAVAKQAVEARIAVATCGETPAGVLALLDLDDAAREAGVAVVAGAGFAPGLSEVLARYAADRVDAVEEVHVASLGSAGPASRRWVRRSFVEAAMELRDGRTLSRRPLGDRRLVPFPAPMGTVECRRASSPVPHLVAACVSEARRVGFRRALRWSDLAGAGLPGRSRARASRSSSIGALHVEVRARRGGEREILTFGAVDRVGAAAGTVLALAALEVAGAGEGRAPAGARPLGLLVEPERFLVALAQRGVRAATFDAPVSTAASD